MLRASLAALVLLSIPAGAASAQHCLEPHVVAGAPTMVHSNLGSPTVVWLEIVRDSAGADPASLYVLPTNTTPGPRSTPEFQVPVGSRAVVRVPVGHDEHVWLGLSKPAPPAPSGGAAASSTTEPRPSPALRYRLCFRQ